MAEGDLHNAATLMKDAELLPLIAAASVYIAREVVAEAPAAPNHATKLKMAAVVITDPNRHAAQIQAAFAADPAMAALGNTASVFTEKQIIDGVRVIFGPMATMFYPATP